MYETELLSILEASQNNALTFFVGAGVSKLSDAPSWKELIDEFCDKLGRTKKDTYSTDELLQIPQMYWSTKKQKSGYFKIIQEKLNYYSLIPNDIHHEMLNLSPVSFLTTNYDLLLEDAAIRDCQSFKVVSSDEEVPNIFGDRFILKIHGDLSHKNIVLKEEDYLNYSEHFKLIETLVKSIFATNTVVFIGYGLNDYNIRLILNWTKELLGDSYRKPIFIRTEESTLREEELQYHEESRGLSVVECIKILLADKEKSVLFQAATDSKEKYTMLYKSVFDEIKKLSKNSMEGMTEDKAFEKLFKLLQPLDDMQALRINDVYKKLSPYVSFDADGEIYAHEGGELLLKKFYSIFQMSTEEQEHLSKEAIEKYSCILRVFKKARIYRANSIHSNLFNLSEVPFADEVCISFDYSEMQRFVSQKRKNAVYNYKKAFYLSRLKRYDEALFLFSDVAKKAYGNKDVLLYYLAKSNCISLGKAIKNIQNVYHCYDQNKLDKYLPSDSEASSLFYRLPVEFRNKYDVFKDIYSSYMLYEYSYGAFVDSKKVQNAIESESLEFGLTSSDKAICKINEYMHFMLKNGIVADMFEEYKNSVRNLLSALVYKHSTCSKKVLHETLFPYRNSEEITFDENDFYCFIECFKEKEIRQLFRRHKIETFEFINMDLIEKAVNNILTYYEHIEKEWKKRIEVLTLQTSIKACLALLEYVQISQKMVDKICTFIFSHEFREISFSDKKSFLFSQLNRRNMHSTVTDKIIKDSLMSYLDQHIATLMNNTSKTKSSESVPPKYYELIYYISSNEKSRISRRLSSRVTQIMDFHLTSMYSQIARSYHDYISKAQRERVIAWAKKEIQSDFSFILIVMIINCHGKLESRELTALKTFLWEKVNNAKKPSNTHIEHFPQHDPFEELDQVGFWCLAEDMNRADFKEFVGHSVLFDFFFEYNNFDYSRFNVSWLLSFYPRTLELISKDDVVKEKIRKIVATRIKTDRINESDKDKLQNILIKYFC